MFGDSRMYKYVSYFLLFASLTVSEHAISQGRDGGFFLQACNAAVKISDGTKVSNQEEMLALYCSTYVSGFLDAMSITVSTTKGTKVVCTPDKGITNDQAVRILVK